MIYKEIKTGMIKSNNINKNKEINSIYKSLIWEIFVGVNKNNQTLSNNNTQLIY